MEAYGSLPISLNQFFAINKASIYTQNYQVILLLLKGKLQTIFMYLPGKLQMSYMVRLTVLNNRENFGENGTFMVANDGVFVKYF